VTRVQTLTVTEISILDGVDKRNEKSFHRIHTFISERKDILQHDAFSDFQFWTKCKLKARRISQIAMRRGFRSSNIDREGNALANKKRELLKLILDVPVFSMVNRS
jgi:hypothetical protein